MDLIADSLLVGGAIAATFYCWVLSVRLRSLKDLDNGLGGAIAGLSRQVDEMKTTLKAAKTQSEASQAELDDLAARADKAAERLRDLLEDAESTERAHRRSAKIAPFPRNDPEKIEEHEAEDKSEPEEADATVSLAQQLQRDIRQRIAGRDDIGGKDELVKTLQDILAASK